MDFSHVRLGAVAPDGAARWAGFIPASFPQGRLGSLGGCGRDPSKSCEGGPLAAGTAVRWTVEVMSIILKRLVRLKDMKPVAPNARLAYLITSNDLGGE